MPGHSRKTSKIPTQMMMESNALGAPQSYNTSQASNNYQAAHKQYETNARAGTSSEAHTTLAGASSLLGSHQNYATTNHTNARE